MSTAPPFFDPERSREPMRPPPPAAPSGPVRPPHHKWRRIFAWAGIIVIGLIVVLAAGITMLLHSRVFHRYALAEVNAIATQSLNAKVDVENFALHFSPLGVDVYGVVVHGANPYTDPPLLELQHAYVGLGIGSLIHRSWYLTDVRLDRPVLRIFIDKNGVSNIPKPKPSKGKSNTTIWNLGIRQAVLNRGEIYYNAQSTPLSADLHDVELRAAFNALQTVYSGDLRYTRGRVVFDRFRPFVHNFEAVFDLTPSTFRLQRARLSSGGTQVDLTATATNFSAPHIQAKYDVTIDGAQMAQLMRDPYVPAGIIHLAGVATYQQVANVPALQTVALAGHLSSQKLVIRTSSLAAVIQGLAAHYSLDHGDAALHDLRAGILGGELTVQGTMKQIGSAAPHSEVTASLRHISLAQADRLAAHRLDQTVSIAGELNANAHAAWGKSINDLVARMDATIHGNAGSRRSAAPTVLGTFGSNAGTQPMPVSSEIHAVYTGTNQQLAVAKSYLRMPQTTLTMNGTVSHHSSLAIALQANNLGELASLAEMFRTPASGQAQPFSLAGSATFNGHVTGSTSAPHLTGQLVARDLRLNGSSWKIVRVGVEASPSQARLIDADLEPIPKGRIGINATAGLHQWAFTKTSPFRVDLIASELDVAALSKLTGKDIPISGTLNTQLNLSGSTENLTGHGELSLVKASVYNEPVNSVLVHFSGTGNQAQADLSVRLPAGAIRSSLSVSPKQKTFTAQVSSSGIAIGKLEVVKARDLGAAGNVAFQATGKGRFENPQVTASIRIPALTIKNQQVADVRIDANVANHVADATLLSAALHSNIRARAHIQLSGDYETDASIDTQDIPLQPLIALWSPANAVSLSGATALHADIHGPLKDKAALQAHITIPYLRVAYNNTIQLAASAPIRADFKNSVLTVQRSAIEGTDTNLEFQGSVPVGRQGPISALLKGDINLQLAQALDPDIRSSGEIRLNVDTQAASIGAIRGEVQIVNASYASASLPVGLQKGNGVLKLAGDRVDIQSFHGTVGGGEVSASGGVQYSPSLRFNFGATAKNVRMLYPQGMREAVDARLRLAGTAEDALLSGTVNLTDLSFTPGFDLASFTGQFSGGVASPPSVGGISQNIRLNVAVRSSNNVNLASRTLSVNGSANLQVRGTADNPVILGRIDLNGGDMILNGDRFVLTGGTVQFVNPSETQPVVNATITTTIQQYNIDMRFRGPVNQMETQYTSDPALPQADIIHLLAFGNTTEAAANSPATPANQMAESLVANQVSSQITSRVARVAGISQLSINPVLGNGQSSQAGANITVQQRVTGNLFVTFTDNTAEGTQTIQGQYKVSPRVSVSGTRDPNGGFAADVLIKKEY